MDIEKAEFFKRIGFEIRQIRLKKRLTLEDMQEYGFSPQHFQKVETGKKEISLYTMYRISKAFKVKLSSLFRPIE